MSPYRYRPYADTALEAVLAFIEAMPELDTVGRETFLDFLSSPANRNGTDFVLAHRGAALVGLLMSGLYRDTEPAFRHIRIAVHPDHRRQGIGRALLDRARSQDRLPEMVVQGTCKGSWRSGRAFADAQGFALHRDERLLERECRHNDRNPPLDPRLRPFEGSDRAAWKALHDLAFCDREDVQPLERGSMEAELARPGAALWVAELEGHLLAYCHVFELSPSRLLLNHIVVAPEARRKGLASALLDAAHRRGINGGYELVEANTEASNHSARALFAGQGYQEVDSLLTYRRRA